MKKNFSIFLSNSNNISNCNVYPKEYKPGNSLFETKGNIPNSPGSNSPLEQRSNEEESKMKSQLLLNSNLNQKDEDKDKDGNNLLMPSLFKDIKLKNSNNESISIFGDNQFFSKVQSNGRRRKKFKPIKYIKKLVRRIRKDPAKKNQITEENIKNESGISKNENPIYENSKNFSSNNNFKDSENIKYISEINFSPPQVIIRIIESFGIFSHLNQFYDQYLLKYLLNLLNQLNTFKFSENGLINVNSEKWIQVNSQVTKMGYFKRIVENHILKTKKCFKYERRSDFMLLKRSLLSKENIFLRRDSQFFFFSQITRQRSLRNKNRVVQKKLRKAMGDIKEKSIKNSLSGRFQNDIFRKKGKQLAFQRKSVHFPWIFYATQAAPIKLHISNLFSKNNYELNLYDSSSDWFDVADHNGSIYSAGGYQNGVYLNTVWNINYLLGPRSSGVALSPLCEGRSGTTLLSTPFDLIVLGGYIRSCIKSCERFKNLRSWRFIANLNKASYGISAQFIYPHYIYTFGGSDSTNIEVLNLLNPSKWDILPTKNENNRESGFCFMNNKNEVLIFGGSRSSGDLYTFQIKESKLIKSKIKYPYYAFHHSKVKLIDGKLKAISYRSGKIIDFSFKKLAYKEVNLFF